MTRPRRGFGIMCILFFHINKRSELIRKDEQLRSLHSHRMHWIRRHVIGIKVLDEYDNPLYFSFSEGKNLIFETVASNETVYLYY